MCNNIMVCEFLIQDLKVSLCIANLVHMTAVMVSPALKAQKQELSLQDRVTYNMKVLIAIRQTSQKDLAQAMGIAAPTLSQKFSGRTRWNMDDIEKASDFLDVKPEALVAGHGFEPWDLWVMRPPKDAQQSGHAPPYSTVAINGDVVTPILRAGFNNPVRCQVGISQII